MLTGRQGGRGPMSNLSTTEMQLLVVTGAYAVALVVVVYLTRAGRRRGAAAFAGGLSAGGVGLAAAAVGGLDGGGAGLPGEGPRGWMGGVGAFTIRGGAVPL